jgi:hypothetical protein
VLDCSEGLDVEGYLANDRLHSTVLEEWPVVYAGIYSAAQMAVHLGWELEEHRFPPVRQMAHPELESGIPQATVTNLHLA